MKRFLTCLLLLASACEAQGARIFIVTDLEGAGGVNDPEGQLLPGQRRYPESRRILTGEVNAAVEGALAAGASQVVIWDGYDGSRTLLSAAQAESRSRRPDPGRAGGSRKSERSRNK